MLGPSLLTRKKQMSTFEHYIVTALKETSNPALVEAHLENIGDSPARGMKAVLTLPASMGLHVDDSLMLKIAAA